MAGACKKAQGAALGQAAPAPGRAEGSARRPERPQEPPPFFIAFLFAERNNRRARRARL